MLKKLFSPGCALMLYKPELAEKLLLLLNENHGQMDQLDICCRHNPGIKETTEIINICPGCDKRFGNDYQGVTTVSLWEILAERDFFEFPDYHGREMTILDACPTRSQERVHNAVRTLLRKMNITLVEPKNTRTKSVCCGDTFYGTIPTVKVKEFMAKRGSEMPREEVVVYCVSCIKAMYIGGKQPRYLVDLLLGEETLPKTFEPDAWHAELTAYIDQH